MSMGGLFPIDQTLPLEGDDRKSAISVIVQNHYAHSFPSGKSHIFRYEDAIIVYSIPANMNIGRFVLGRPGIVWELTRLWAPDGHRANLLTQAISTSMVALRKIEPGIEGLVSFADPNVGHLGGIYRAASWIDTGQSEESRYYQDAAGQVVSRRKFHSGGGAGISEAEILAKGYVKLKRPGKHRFVKPLTQSARRAVRRKWGK